MKGKVTRGSAFAGALGYAADEPGHGRGEDKNAVLVASNIDTSQTLRNQAQQMRTVALLRSDIKKPVVHFSLSLPPIEKISIQQWATISRDFLDLMGLSQEHQFRVDLHQDKPHQHIHIVANRVSVGGQVWTGQYEAMRMIEATQKLEKKHGLKLTEGLVFSDKKKKNPSRNEFGKAERTGKIPPRIHIQNSIDVAKKQGKSFSDFVQSLKKLGVTVLPSGKTGAVSGCSFIYSGMVFKGSDLGQDYKWSKIKMATGYDQARDAAIIQTLRSFSPATQQTKPISSYPVGRPGPRSNAGQFDCGDEVATNDKDERRKKFQTMLLEKAYHATVNRAFVELLLFVKITNGQVEISLLPTGKIIDSGDRITANSGSRDEIAAMVELAKTKGWKTLRLSGSSSFIERAALQAMKEGFPMDAVSAKNPSHKGAIDRSRARFMEYQKNEQNSRTQSQISGADQRRNFIPDPGVKEASRSPATALKRTAPEPSKTAFSQPKQVSPNQTTPAHSNPADGAKKPAAVGSPVARVDAVNDDHPLVKVKRLRM